MDNDINSQFFHIIRYLEKLSENLGEELYLSEEIQEQKENINDMNQLLKEFGSNSNELESIESIKSDETLSKLMQIHIYMSDLNWHISELKDLNQKFLKICASKREVEDG